MQNKLCTVHLTDEYTELHHIYPKSIQCDIDVKQKLNVVKLTAREHFIAHLLLTRMFSNGVINQKMNFAFFQLRLSNKYQQRYTNSRFYDKLKKIKRKYIRFYKETKCVYADVTDIARQQLLDTQGWSTIMPDEYKVGRVGNMIGKKHSEETKRRMSESGKNVDRSYLRNLPKEVRMKAGLKAAETRKRRELADPSLAVISRKKQSESHKELYRSGKLSHVGKNNPRYGTVCNAETKQKISEFHQRRGNMGMTHQELFDNYIKPHLDMSLKDLMNILPVKKSRYDLQKIIKKCGNLTD